MLPLFRPPASATLPPSVIFGDYDNDGNLLSGDGVKTYKWDAEIRATSIMITVMRLAYLVGQRIKTHVCRNAMQH
jgi:hypothetical protein